MQTIKELDFLNAVLPLAVILFIICMGVVFLNLHFQKNLTQQKLQQESLKIKYQQELLRAQIQAQEEERKRIAHDLHDELGAAISILRMHLMVLEQQHGACNASLQAGLQNVRVLSDTALASVRSISYRLMPPQLESFGLLVALESITHTIEQTGEIAIQLQSNVNTEEWPWLINLGLFRMIMELINNTIKHAAASHIIITLTQQATSIQCAYSDDGKGLQENTLTKGMGLKSIDVRVNALAGTWNSGNRSDGGFFANIELPFTTLSPINHE